MKNGTVKFFNETKGFGFIKEEESNKEYFVHVSGLVDEIRENGGTLEAFEIAQKDDAEETDSNHFQGCELTIEDDKGREFTTKNPFIINAVAKMVNTLCVDKLTEIEGEIFIPVK